MILLFSSAHLLAHGTIMIEGVEHSEGFIDVKIYENEDSFLKEEIASEVIRKKATQGKTVIPLSKIHEGQIAIVIYHDEDSNGKLKTGFFGVQKRVLLLVIITPLRDPLNFPKLP